MRKMGLWLGMLLLCLALASTGALAQSAHGGMGSHGVHAVSPTDSFVPAEDPAYPVGTQVRIETDHMEGMLGALGTVSGAFQTVIYAIDYTDVETGESVLNHKWVIHEELQGDREAPYAVGDTVILKAGHISSMGGEGAEATIVEVIKGVAYMVDYMPTDGGEEVVDHQWVVESELRPAA
ncbi:MAG: YdhK family protein [Candidatus Limiplasma sp.]|nr:YdhK family protein [Candidatus Limiplasma sp.]